jgi:agmatinase
MYTDDKSGNLKTPHSLGRYRDGGLVTTNDPRRFVGIPTFLRVPLMTDVTEPKIGIVGVPYDGGVARTPGTRFGPRGIRNACWRAPEYHPALDVSLTAHNTVVDCGDMLVSPFSISDALETIDRNISELLAAGIVPVSVGGDHGITYPILQAMNRVHGKVAVIHFDAHADTLEGGYTHGTMFRLAVDEGLIQPDKFIQVGIRKTYSAADFDFQKQHGIQVISVDELRALGDAGLAEQFRRLEGCKVYVTFDMDFVDQAHAPGTGSPEPCGPTSAEALACFRAIEGLDVIGFDLTEVSPPYDVREMTCYLANLVLFEMVALLISASIRR